MEQRFHLGIHGGTLTVREEGPRAAFEAVIPDDKQGLYKAYITGAGGRVLLGTLMPENGRLRLQRTLTIDELARKRIWPTTGGVVELAFAFGGTASVPAQGVAYHGDAGWHREENPARLMGDRILAQAAGELRGALSRHENGGFALAAPMEGKAVFPMLPLFCFAHVETLGERPYAVFHFNAQGCPIFQNKEN